MSDVKSHSPAANVVNMDSLNLSCLIFIKAVEWHYVRGLAGSDIDFVGKCLDTAVTAVRSITSICISIWCLRKKDFIYTKCIFDINALIQIRINAKQCWSRFNIEKNRKMKSFTCYNQILLRNVLRDCICVLYRACSFDHVRRIFSSNERRIFVNISSFHPSFQIQIQFIRVD